MKGTLRTSAVTRLSIEAVNTLDHIGGPGGAITRTYDLVPAPGSLAPDFTFVGEYEDNGKVSFCFVANASCAKGHINEQKDEARFDKGEAGRFCLVKTTSIHGELPDDLTLSLRGPGGHTVTFTRVRQG